VLGLNSAAHRERRRNRNSNHLNPNAVSNRAQTTNLGLLYLKGCEEFSIISEHNLGVFASD
jgi:hypothetical protein